MTSLEDNNPKLTVYECRGPKGPRNEPVHEGFLGIWPEAPYYYLFFDRQADSFVEGWIGAQAGWSLRGFYHMDYDQWQQIAPGDQRVGPFLIRTGVSSGSASPHWDADVLPLLLNPGLVFGSGVHPTTRGCLLAMVQLFPWISPQTVVDLGTGTGILAVACGLLGARRVWALDCLPLAVKVARNNVSANKLEEVVSLLVAQDLKVFREPADLLLMNIEWPCLRQALQSGDWIPYGWVVLSGFLKHQWQDVKDLLPPGVRIFLKVTIEGWMTVMISGR